MTALGAASASDTTQFRPLAIDGAVYFLRASLDDGEIELELTDGAESWYGSARDLNFKDAGVDRDEFARTVLAGLQRGGDGATFTLKHLHDGGRQLEWSVQREMAAGLFKKMWQTFVLLSDVTGERLPRALAALVREAAALQQRHDAGGARARGLAAREAELEAVRAQLDGARERMREEVRQRCLDELNRHKRRIEQLDGALRRWEERGADDSDSDGGRRSSESDDDGEAAPAPAPAVAAAAPAAAGPSGVAPAADDDDDLLSMA